MHKTLQGKCALITGGGRGIGRGITLALAAQGCHVAVHYARNRSEADSTVAAAAALGVQAVALRANLARVDAAHTLVQETVAALGSVDILIGNAASGVLKPIVELESKDWEWTVNINARSLLTAAQAAAPYMQQAGWGRIVTISSPGSRRVFPHYSVVGISKAALEAITRYLAVELAPFGITANCVVPGLVETGALEHFPMREEMIAHAKAHTPAGRLLTPEDVAALVTWLCSDAAAMMVGQTIELDGGYGLRMMD